MLWIQRVGKSLSKPIECERIAASTPAEVRLASGNLISRRASISVIEVSISLACIEILAIERTCRQAPTVECGA